MSNNILMSFTERLSVLKHQYQQLKEQKNEALFSKNGVFSRYKYPVLTAGHIPLDWRYDMDALSNPYLMERNAFNAVFNPAAIKWQNKYLLVARVEGADRKSFFAVAESADGVDHFSFWDRPVLMPETAMPDTNVYDMRLTAHEDGYIYGLFCTERRDPSALHSDQSAATAQCGIARTHNLVNWERLPDLVTPSAQQRNVVLHPEFVKDQYAFYTRPQDGFIDAGSGGGIGLGLSPEIDPAVIAKEVIIDNRRYHTVYEAKNGQGPAPLKTPYGWLHLAHGVRNTAAGLRYVLYMFMTDLHDLAKVIYKPAGYFLAPEGEERIGDVSNVVFCNGWIEDEGKIFIYYASSDTRVHLATSTLDQLLDYVMHTPQDEWRSAASVARTCTLIDKNKLTEKIVLA